MSEKRLYRSEKDRMIGGVCGGIAKYFNTDPVIIRVIAIILLFAWSFGFWAYIILWIVVPTKSEVIKTKRKKPSSKKKTIDKNKSKK